MGRLFFCDLDAAFGEVGAALAIEKVHEEFEFLGGAFWIGGVSGADSVVERVLRGSVSGVARVLRGFVSGIARVCLTCNWLGFNA